MIERWRRARVAQAPATPLALGTASLAPALGRLQPPIRDGLLGAASFARLGRRLAAGDGVPAKAARGSPFFPRLRQNIAVLHQAQRWIAQVRPS